MITDMIWCIPLCIDLKRIRETYISAFSFLLPPNSSIFQWLLYLLAWSRLKSPWDRNWTHWRSMSKWLKHNFFVIWLSSIHRDLQVPPYRCYGRWYYAIWSSLLHRYNLDWWCSYRNLGRVEVGAFWMKINLNLP